MRWVLRFKVQGGRDYLDQLKSMGAVILVPRPEDAKQMHLLQPGQRQARRRTGDGGLASDRLINALANKIQLQRCPPRRGPGRRRRGRISTSRPRTFWAFFPKEIEDELARLETGYRNKRSDDIEETIFRVTIRGGSYDIIVDEQRMKR